MNSQTLAADAATWKITSSGTRWEQFRDSGSLDSGLHFADSPFDRWPLRISILLILAVLSASVLLAGPLRYPSHVVTAPQEQRSVTLADGSVLTLESDSEARVAFTANERHVMLTRGAVLLNVASEPGRAFLVSTPEATVKSGGTLLKVLTSAKRTAVSVVEGSAMILPPLLDEIVGTQPAASRPLAAGEHAWIGRNGDVSIGNGPLDQFRP